MKRILSTLILTLYTSICFSQKIKTIDTINLDEVAVKILREPNKKNLSVFSINSIATGSELMFSVQAASHGAGQILPVNSGKLFVA